MRNRIIAALTAVSLLAQVSSGAEEPKPYRVGYNNWIGFISFFIAQERGDFKKAGLNVVGSSFDAPGAGLVPLLSGSLDAHLTTLDAVIMAADKAPGQLKIVGLVDTSKGADAVIGSAKLKSTADLKGKKIGVTLGECGHILLSKALASAGLKETDATLVNMSPDAAGTALKAGQIDAAVTWEPWITQLIGDGGHAIYTTEKTPNLLLDCVAVTTGGMKSKAAETKIFLAVMDEVTKFVLAEPAKAAVIAAPLFELPAAEIEGMLKKLTLYDSAAAKQQMAGPVSEAGVEIAEFFKAQKIVQSPADVKSLIDTSLLP